RSEAPAGFRSRRGDGHDRTPVAPQNAAFPTYKRREFITLLGGAASWPLAARAQQRERMRRIGFLMNLAADDPVAQARNAAFLQALQELGWTAGRNLQIEYRWGGEIADRNREYAAELVALAPNVIVAGGSSPGLAALRRATRTIPIVFASIVD